MKKQKRPSLPVFFLVLLLSQCTISQIIAQQSPKENRPIPRVERENGLTRLFVDGKPWVMLGGELHNSSASSLQYMEPVWDKLVNMHLNTVIATMSWELFEPQEGKYDYTLVDGIIKGAREHNLKLVLIWFGTWKNASASYAPAWLRTDMKRFPRMQPHAGDNSGSMSAFSRNNVEADSKAFKMLMRRIKDIDSKDRTVIMMQVENESGLLETDRLHPRDRSVLADSAFNKKVPSELISYLLAKKDVLTPELKDMMTSAGNKKEGSWQDVFGYGADEVFTAWHIGRYIGEVAAAGKSEYNIPMYVNAWLDPDFSMSRKVQYPAGGPVSKMLDIWRAAAPSIDLFAPDIYLEDFKRVCRQYTYNGNPLLIPEAQRDSRAAANVYYVLGQYNCLGFCPFGIDNENTSKAIAESYRSLTEFLPSFTKYQGEGKNIGFLYSGDKTEELELAGYKFTITFTQERNIEKDIPEGAGIILNTGPGEFFITGRGFRFAVNPPDMELELYEDGRFVNGAWIAGRRLNGDELYFREIGNKPEIQRIKYVPVKK